MHDEPFGPAYDWCDAFCTRCPLSASCPMLDRTDEELDPNEPSLLIERLQSAGLEYLTTLHAVLDAHGGTASPHGVRAWAAGVRVPPQSRRVAATEGELRHARLMVVEELDAECVANLGALCALQADAATPFMRARAALWALLEPWQRELPERARQEIESWVDAGRAPSPFAVVSPKGR